ncbi:uroporphyrinogen-III synthase [Robiginitalea sp.]|uniref:uroporphyrinogen-III synthase n=1 Tax=Robiginitalea sp. TaxID=1902411 RepID=UPI003C43EEFF
MRHLLSTKVLSDSEIRQLEAVGWQLDQYDAISIEFQKTTVAPDDHLLIFSSKNAVAGFFNSFLKRNLSSCKCLCVGNGAAAMLTEKGMSVLESYPTAKDLAASLEKNHPSDSIVYYCGNRRLDLIPDTLDDLGLSWQEATVYKTLLNPKKWDRVYDAVVFFSPSSVQSYVALNPLGAATGYCIGKTTGAALEKYTHRILFPKTPDRKSLMDLLLCRGNELK